MKRALLPLLDWVERDTQRLFDENREKVLLDSFALSGSANSYSRQLGYKPAHMSLPREIKAKSRLGMLVHHKLMTETAAHTRNPNPKKQLHKFSRTVTLGATDSQMVTLERSEQELFLHWKCWDEEYTLIFNIPQYIQQRNITKWSLPTVSSEGFLFTTQEDPTPITTGIIAGLDLGRVEPFVMVVLSQNSKLAGEFHARPQLKKTNAKRERILQEVKFTTAKIAAYHSLGLGTEKLRLENTRNRAKVLRLGASLAGEVAANVTRISVAQRVEILHIENLKWAVGKKYGSRWNHGETSNKIEHASARAGVKVRRVNPRGTSQHCFKCGTTVKHDTKKRSVWCSGCQSQLDRDKNAALNIALNNSYPSLSNRLVGGACSHNWQSAEPTAPKSHNTNCSLR